MDFQLLCRCQASVRRRRAMKLYFVSFLLLHERCCIIIFSIKETFSSSSFASHLLHFSVIILHFYSAIFFCILILQSFSTMAQQSSQGQYMRYSASRSSAVPASTTGAIMQYSNDLTNKSYNELIYELVSLDTRYSSVIVAYSQRLQSRTSGVDKL